MSVSDIASRLASQSDEEMTTGVTSAELRSLALGYIDLWLALNEMPHAPDCASHLPMCSIPEHGNRPCNCPKSRMRHTIQPTPRSLAQGAGQRAAGGKP